MSRSAPGGPPPANPADEGLTAFSYPGPDWRLLVRLPGRVLTAALADQTVEPGVRVRSAVAGLAAIAAGRLFDSELVRAVATAIYAEAGAPGPARTTGAGGPAEVLAACRAAVALLGRADPADSAAYRQWVQSVAARTVGFPTPAGAASGFVAELGRALGLPVTR